VIACNISRLFIEFQEDLFKDRVAQENELNKKAQLMISYIKSIYAKSTVIIYDSEVANIITCYFQNWP
jgi:hypothetical protein